MKGIIALDIDGTITAKNHDIPKKVIDYLKKIAAEGWCLIFITGRPFSWAYQTLESLTFPYYFAVQNGALILDMPSRKIRERHYLTANIFPQMEEICREEPSDYVIYSGFENQDICYYRPQHFSSDLLNYVNLRSEKIKETWVAVSSYEDLPVSHFPSVKCFGKLGSAKRIFAAIEKDMGLHAPLMRDPLGEGYYVVQVTAPHVTKGETLLYFKKNHSCTGPIIAAGDDTNDESMLKVADIKIVMETAPKDILQLADIVAPSADHEGIIEGIKAAINRTR